MLWSVVWLAMVKNDPVSDKRMSNAERSYLAQRLSIVNKQGAEVLKLFICIILEMIVRARIMMIE